MSAGAARPWDSKERNSLLAPPVAHATGIFNAGPTGLEKVGNR
jgi:hypothetical protein